MEADKLAAYNATRNSATATIAPTAVDSPAKRRSTVDTRVVAMDESADASSSHEGKKREQTLSPDTAKELCAAATADPKRRKSYGALFAHAVGQATGSGSRQTSIPPADSDDTVQ